jgi:hypothetical protein
MVKFLFHSFWFMFLAAGPLPGQYQMRFPNSYYLPENWPAFSLKMTREGTLRELFEAGLRPGYTGVADRSELDIKHTRLTFVLADGRSLPEFAAEYGRISVTRAGLAQLHFVSQQLSVEEAKATMVKWLPFFSENRRQTETALDDFLRKVAADYSGFDDPNFGAAPEGFGGGWKDDNWVGYGVHFQKAYNEVLPVRIYFNLVWDYIRTEREMRNFYRQPIPPPEGYEIPRLTNWGPDSTSEMMYAKGIPFPPGQGLSGRDQNDVVEVVERGPEPQKPTTESKSTASVEENNSLAPEEEPPRRLTWLLAGVFLLGMLAILFKSLKSRSYSKGPRA